MLRPGIHEGKGYYSTLTSWIWYRGYIPLCLVETAVGVRVVFLVVPRLSAYLSRRRVGSFQDDSLTYHKLWLAARRVGNICRAWGGFQRRGYI